MKKRVVIAGSRHFDDYASFCAIVDACLSRIRHEYEIVILSGHCRGTDCMAERYARENAFELEIYPADWRLGHRAGPMRNKVMVDAADFAIAFPGGGPGTRSLITYARAKGIPLRVFPVVVP